MALLASVHRRHAERIYLGSKTTEFRRATMRVPSLPTWVYLYETLPVGKITGRALVERVTFGGPDELAGFEADAFERRFVTDYLSGKQSATALHLTGAERWAAPLDLRDMGLSRAPQSYCRLGAEWDI